MITRELARSLTQRFRRPTTWGAILGFGFVWILTRLLAGVAFARLGIWEFVVPSLFLLGHLALSAAPWQWTGDSRPSAPPWRGSLQALLWNVAWVFLILWGVHDIVRPARPVAATQSPTQTQRPDSTSPRPENDRPPRSENDRPLRSEDERPPRPENCRPPRSENDRPPRSENERPPKPRLTSENPSSPENRPQEKQEATFNRAPSQEPQQDRTSPPLGLRPEVMLLLINLPFAMVLGWFLSEKERIERAEEELRERERQARARALQSQLHPHVLFNVLGGLTELVHEDADAAEEALVGLTELLRMLMKQGAALSQPLGQERALLRRYLGIESIRLGSRLEVQWTWQDDLDALEVPPLLLQPLVENAIKHGISPDPDGGVLRVEAIRTGTGILLRAANTGFPLEGKAKDGTGLGNLRERLALLPEPRPILDLRQEGAWTVAEIRIDGALNAGGLT